MEYICPNCDSKNYNTENIEIITTEETVTIARCVDCNTVVNASIGRPDGIILKRKRGAGEIRFSENEKRSFTSLLLAMMETQTELLKVIALEVGVDKSDVKKISKTQAGNKILYEYLIGEYDDPWPYGDRS